MVISDFAIKRPMITIVAMVALVVVIGDQPAPGDVTIAADEKRL